MQSAAMFKVKVGNDKHGIPAIKNNRLQEGKMSIRSTAVTLQVGERRWGAYGRSSF